MQSGFIVAKALKKSAKGVVITAESTGNFMTH